MSPRDAQISGKVRPLLALHAWCCSIRPLQSVREAKGTDAQLRGESSRIEQLTPEEEKKLAKFLRELAMEVKPPTVAVLVHSDLSKTSLVFSGVGERSR